MTECVFTPRDESVLGEFVRTPNRLSFGEAVSVGVVDGAIATLLLTHKAEDTAGKVVEYAMVKPTGVTLAVFSALCLKSAVSHVIDSVKTNRSQG